MSTATRLGALNAKEVAELKAHHLACGQLVRGCQDAIFRLRARADGDLESDFVSFRAVEILEDIVGSWCDTLAILRTALNLGSSRHGPGLDSAVHPDARDEAGADSVAWFARPPLPGASSDQPAP
jgi:hypothetical protein